MTLQGTKPGAARIVVGTSFFGLLAILFIALKLTGFIGWSWWSVLAPLWLPSVMLFLIAAILLALGWLLGKLADVLEWWAARR
jgi:hypothetical protein